MISDECDKAIEDLKFECFKKLDELCSGPMRLQIIGECNKKIKDLELECAKKLDEAHNETVRLKQKVTDEYSYKTAKMKSEFKAKINKLLAQLNELLEIKKA